MKSRLTTAAALAATLAILGVGGACAEDSEQSAANTASGVAAKVGKAIARGAKAAARGIERGANAPTAGSTRASLHRHCRQPPPNVSRPLPRRWVMRASAYCLALRGRPRVSLAPRVPRHRPDHDATIQRPPGSPMAPLQVSWPRQSARQPMLWRRYLRAKPFDLAIGSSVRRERRGGRVCGHRHRPPDRSYRAPSVAQPGVQARGFEGFCPIRSGSPAWCSTRA